MAYDRYDTRRGWREPRSRFASDDGDRFEGRRNFGGADDRGFFERAGDEVASWFGDDEAEARRREDARRFGSDDEFGRYDRQPRFRDEGYRRPYTGRFFGRHGFGEEYDRGFGADRGWSPDRREFGGMATGGLHDPHYGEWRQRQVNELDRDYDDYRRENQSRFESDFANWRSARQGKRQLLGQVKEHMTVVGSDDEHVGTVDHVRSDRIILAKNDSDDQRHHVLSCSLVDRVEGDKVILDQPAAEAKQRFQGLDRDRGLLRDDDRDSGPHILNRAFSGTYER